MPKMNSTDNGQHKLDPERLRQVLPDRPGVYLFKDCSGRVIYVGKAKSVKSRVLSYLKTPVGFPQKTILMMKRASGLDFILTPTEKEAFILESNLIKKHMPRYNIILRDDKRYPCLRLEIDKPYPRLTIVRKIKKDGALYFGPFSCAHSVRSTVKVIDRVFQLRKCKGGEPPKRARPCLNYQMDRCLAPCCYNIAISEYRQIVRQVRLFLEGRNRELVQHLKKDMAGAAEKLDFERGARIRDQIRAIEKTVERQHMVSPLMEDQDIIGLAQMGMLYQAVILFVRKGYVVGSRSYLFKEPGGVASQVMEALLKQYYLREAFIPKQIFISEPIEDLSPIAEWLCDLAEKKVVICRPLRGEKLRLVRMAVANAENLLIGYSESQDKDLMKTVQSVLRLDSVPRFIEGLDISNLGGDKAVGSIVTFVDGLPHRSGYRNYRIKAVNGIDDYAMMAELIERRVSKGQLPDLFLVDGGKGHLSVVRRVLKQQTKPGVTAVVSIAKADEKRQEDCDKIYLADRKNPIILNAGHPVLVFLMRIRDEAHRRAISYHRRLREKNLMKSDLNAIPGIGIKRKRLLLEHFKDINAIATASLGELAGTPGINRSLAESIFASFQGKRDGKGE